MWRHELLKTPQEFIEEESENLRRHLNNYDIHVNKLGLVGFLMNLLGNMRYDATNYYQGLFKESFVALAEHENNLYMHSSIYGYVVPFAEPSIASGTIVFDFSYLPRTSSAKRIATLTNLKFEYDGIPFQSKTRYHFVEDNQSYYAIIYFEDGTTSYVPSPTRKIAVPFFNVYQHRIVKETFNIDDYSYGSYYPYEFNTGEEFLHDLEVFVTRKPDADEVQEELDQDRFEVKSVKYLEDQFSKTAFLKMHSPHDFILEFGSGIRGMYIPDSKVEFYRTVTHGKNGRLSTSKKLKFDPITQSQIRIFEGSEETERKLSLKYFDILFENSDFGTNAPNDDELKRRIIEFIQTREFLIDRKDYYNLTTADRGDFVYSFRKSDVHRNDFYLHKVLRDEYELPYITNCINVQKLNTEESLDNFSISIESETNGTLNGAYSYVVFATDGFYINIPATTQVEVIDPHNSAYLTWEEYPKAKYYIVVVYDGSNYRYFYTYDTHFLDYGQYSNFKNNFISQRDTDLTYFDWRDSYIFFPEYTLNGRDFKSPFVYKYNKNFRWFDGYVFYDNFISLFSISTAELTGHVVPHFQLNVVYDYEEMRTLLYLKSAQASDDYMALITIPGTKIQEKFMQRIDHNVFAVEYTDELYGILEKPTKVYVEIYYTTSEDGINTSIGVLSRMETNEFRQIQKVDDQIKLLNYIADDNNEYVLAVPLIEKDKYMSYREDIDSEVLNNIQENNIRGRRFPGDEVQYRFMNTDMIYNLYLKNSIIKDYEFDLKLPLKLKIKITYDQEWIDNNVINLPKEKEDLYFELTKLLQEQYTGNTIKYYDSQIVDFIHSDRPFFKRVQVSTYDSDGNHIPDGLESYTEEEIMRNLQDHILAAGLSKIELLGYFPHFFYWDVDNIDIQYLF